MFAPLMIAALLAAQPAPTATTPVEVLDIVRYNAALADETLMHHVVELTGPVTEIYRDGMGGYIARMDAAIGEVDWNGRLELHCHFSPAARNALASVKPGAAVTIRGIPRQIKDHLHWPTDSAVRIDVKECELVVRVDELKPPAEK
jgi:hypothetical protein